MQHLSYVVCRVESCKCKQCVADRNVEQLLATNGFVAWNSQVATHDSGTVIGFVLGLTGRGQPIEVTTQQGTVHGSDHRLVHASLTDTVTVDGELCFGRVVWSSVRQWELILHGIAPLLDNAAKAMSRHWVI